MLAALLGWACPACLILDPTDFPPRQNNPARIVDGSTIPDLSDYTYLSRQRLEPMTFRLTVEDEDAVDSPDARVFVDFAQGDASAVFPTIEDDPTDDTRRLVVAQFKPDFFTPGCHVIEVDVVDNSSDWTGPRGLGAEVERDRAVWWLRAFDGDDPNDIPDPLCRPTGGSGGPVRQ